MKDSDISLLIYLGEKTHLFSDFQTSTSKIAIDLNISQQTISRRLKILENQNLITREVNHQGHIIRLNKKAIDYLNNIKKRIDSIYQKRKNYIEGTVEDGLGEGKYYLSLSGYKKRIKKSLNFIVYPGTLNIKVKKQDLNSFLNTLKPIEIKGFRTKQRTFGNLTCYIIQLKTERAAIVVPERTRYDDILEIIAPVNLRQKFNLNTGDKVKIKDIKD